MNPAPLSDYKAIVKQQRIDRLAKAQYDRQQKLKAERTERQAQRFIGSISDEVFAPEREFAVFNKNYKKNVLDKLDSGHYRSVVVRPNGDEVWYEDAIIFDDMNYKNVQLGKWFRDEEEKKRRADHEEKDVKMSKEVEKMNKKRKEQMKYVKKEYVPFERKNIKEMTIRVDDGEKGLRKFLSDLFKWHFTNKNITVSLIFFDRHTKNRLIGSTHHVTMPVRMRPAERVDSMMNEVIAQSNELSQRVHVGGGGNPYSDPDLYEDEVFDIDYLLSGRIIVAIKVNEGGCNKQGEKSHKELGNLNLISGKRVEGKNGDCFFTDRKSVV